MAEGPGSRPGRASRRPPWPWRLLVAAAVWVARRLFGWHLRVRIEGPLPPGDRPAVVVANHTGNLEPFLVAHTVWRATGHWIQPLVKAELFQMPVLSALAPGAGAIPVARDTEGGREDAYAQAVARLDEGGTIYIAPEGTITHDGELLPLRHGAARLALQAGVPVVVVTSFGGQRGFSPVVLVPQRGVLFDVVVEQLEPDADDDPTTLTGRIAATMLDRSQELREQYPQADPDAAWWPPYSEPAEPTRTARENLEQYREAMADAVEQARARMAGLRDEREVDQRLRDARDRASAAATHARERAHELADQVRGRTDELIGAAQRGELGDQLRQRADELSRRAEELAQQAREFAEQVRVASDAPRSGERVDDDRLAPLPTAPDRADEVTRDGAEPAAPDTTRSE